LNGIEFDVEDSRIRDTVPWMRMRRESASIT